MLNKIITKIYHLNTKKIDKRIKILLMSDIHMSCIFKRNKIVKILEKVKKEQPNYICIPGDLIDGVNILEEKDNEEVVLNFLKDLGSITKVIISIGNHDMYRLVNNSFHTKWKNERNEEFFKKINKTRNVRILDNEIYQDKNINFICFTQSFNYYQKEDNNRDLLIDEMNKLILKIDENKYNVLLCHSPIHILHKKVLEESRLMKNIDLILSGHMHNGMVHPILEMFWKSNHGIITPSKKLFSKKMSRGIKKVNDKTLIVSGGITKLSYSSPDFFHHFNDLFPMNIEIINIDN